MSDMTIQNLPARTVKSAPVVTGAMQSSAPSPQSGLAQGKAPARSEKSVVTNSSVAPENASQQRTDVRDQPSSTSPVISSSSNIVTYRDSDSGRLVVKLIDENSNAVVTEFPSKTMLGNYPKPTYGFTKSPSIDTEA